MDQTLKLHDEKIEYHEDKLENIQQDLIDLKVRLGIKDKTNGQVLEYYDNLVEAQELERNERKEADARLREDIKKVDDKIWYVLGAIILMIIFEIFKVHIGG